MFFNSHKQLKIFLKEDINGKINSNKANSYGIIMMPKSVVAIANRGQWEQGCNLYMATDLGPVRAKRTKKMYRVSIWI